MESTEVYKKQTYHYGKLVLGIFAFLVLLFIAGMIPRLSNTFKIDKAAEENPLPKISILEIEPNTKPIELILPSSAQAWHMTPIWARVNGYLIDYLVDIGDVVKKGDLLAEIDTPETDQDVARAQADLANSIAERDIAKVTSDRWDRLWSKNKEAVSKQEVDQYNSNYVSAEAIVLANEKNVARLIQQQEFKYIYAPFDGIITQRSVDIGSLIYGSVNGTPQELFQIVQTDFIRFFVEVPQNYFKQIKEGVEAEITIQEFPNKIFKGKVSRYAKALDPTSRTLLTEIDVENPDGILYAGLFARVKFMIKPVNINFIIPTTALIIRSGPPNVATVDKNNIVHLNQIEIGRDYGKEVEVTSGLKEHDRIIILPTEQIQEGIKVDIIPVKNNAVLQSI